MLPQLLRCLLVTLMVMWLMGEDLSSNISDQPCVPTAAAGSWEQTCLLPRKLPGLLLLLPAPQPGGSCSLRALSFLLCHLGCNVPAPRTLLFDRPCPLAQPSTHGQPQQREWTNEQVRENPSRNELPRGVSEVCGDPLSGKKRNRRRDYFSGLQLLTGGAEMRWWMLILGLAGKWQPLSVNVGLLKREVTLPGLRRGRRKRAELSKQEVELWPVFSSLPTLQCLFAAGAY